MEERLKTNVSINSGETAEDATAATTAYLNLINIELIWFVERFVII